MVLLTVACLIFNFIGMVCDSFIDFDRVFTTEFASAGTFNLTTLPWIDNCLPLGSSHIICKHEWDT